MQYRVLLPESPGRDKLRVVYLLHGGGGNFRDWSNYSNVAEYAARSFLLVMPEGNSSYYINAVSPPQDRYEDFIVDDLSADVERRFPARSDRSGKAIAGVSMGGFGAVNLGLRHPDRFAFVGGLSSAIDVPRRRFTWHRLEQSRRFDRLFGPDGSDTRREHDLFTFVESVDNRRVPYLYLTCGTLEGLLPANREFAARVKSRNIGYEFHEVAGGHDWNQWNGQIKSMFTVLAAKTAGGP
jgi:S-formylglutathione hydrolase FrmB